MNKWISFNRRTITGALLLCVSIVLVISCHKHKEKVNPCAGASRTVATFKIEEISTDARDECPSCEAWNYETDTICTGEALFTVTSEADSVIWKIGAGTYTSKSQRITFGTTMDQVNVPVTLIVFRRPRTDCFADDQSSDTLTKNVYICRAPSSKVWGAYRGTWQEAPSDTFTLQFLNDTVSIDPWAPFRMVNFDKLGCTAGARAIIGYRKARIYHATPGCSDACFYFGEFSLASDNKNVSIAYSTHAYVGYDYVHYDHIFNGQRTP